MMQVETDGAFRTEDMTLAAVLVGSGYDYKLERLNRQRCVWTFSCKPDQEEQFDELVEAYESNNCRVEPRSFMHEIVRVRTEMFRFLGIDDRRRKPGAPSAATS